MNHARSKIKTSKNYISIDFDNDLFTFDVTSVTCTTSQGLKHGKLFYLFHWLICILFYVQTKWLPEQNLKPIQSQNVLKVGEKNNQ